jgi:hypothetical protein
MRFPDAELDLDRLDAALTTLDLPEYGGVARILKERRPVESEPAAESDEIPAEDDEPVPPVCEVVALESPVIEVTCGDLSSDQQAAVTAAYDAEKIERAAELANPPEPEPDPVLVADTAFYLAMKQRAEAGGADAQVAALTCQWMESRLGITVSGGD